jgi:hypothetical protein
MAKLTQIYVTAIGLTLLSSVLAAQSHAVGLDADIETVYTLAGGQQLTSHGHYYRSHDGQLVREDSPLGAVIVDIKQNTVTLLNSETKEARVLRLPPTDKQASKPAGPPPTAVFGHGVAEGHSLTKSRRSGPHGEVHEIWTASDIALVMFIKNASQSMTMTKTLQHVSLHEPDAAIFGVPPGYSVREDSPPADFVSGVSPVGPAAAPPSLKPRK